MPKIGMSNLAMMKSEWIDALKAAAENDFDAFELSCMYPFIDPEGIPPALIDEAKEIAQKAEMEICVHAPFFELNIAAFCSGIREESIKAIKKSVDLCRRLNAGVLVIHNGAFTYDLPAGISKEDRDMITELQWTHNIDSLKKINDYAVSNDIALCLENIGFEPRSMDRRFEDLLTIREKVGKTLLFTLDMGHARLSEGVKKGISLLADGIRHIHLTDNHGEKDDHLPLSDGDCDYSGFIQFLKDFPHIITLEVIDTGTDPKPAIRARDALKSLLSK